MKWDRRFRILGLTLMLLAGVSCSASDTLTGIPDSQPIQQSSPLFGDVLGGLGGVVDGVGGTVNGAIDGLASGDLGSTLGGVIGGVFDITDLLTCKEQKYVAVTETVGPKGGTIKVGEHILDIPAGALSRKVNITAEQMRGSTNSVRFSPEGLRFEKPAALTMSYRNCLVVLLPKSIVYTTEKFKILEVLRSLDLFNKRTVSAPIDHFSRYAVAY
jgi:hypothetical protein